MVSERSQPRRRADQAAHEMEPALPGCHLSMREKNRGVVLWAPSFLPPFNDASFTIMSHSPYSRLIAQFCGLTLFEQPETLLKGQAFQVEGIDFSLIHSEQINPARMTICCDLGELGQTQAPDLCQKLLKMNLSLHTTEKPIFALSPDTGHLVRLQAETVAELTPGSLLQKLKVLAHEARQWRIDPLLLSQERRAPPPSKGASSFASLMVRNR
ncbi:CesT family type III secretion system chaperone [Herbaspirillum huttiense F1]|nr:CesT family type III secretion system chaperone [Herbaspirillum huttiense]MDT0358194.1 CesT family type III secretion system chaperone [Herbaspirillum huttiense F1]